MNSIESIQRAIDYIEGNILEKLDYEMIAKQATMSNYHFQRMFSIICNCTVGEYIRCRRLSLAGNELISTKCKIIDLAIKYGYDSPESFTRAFYKLYGMNPSTARTNKSQLNSYTKISVISIIEGRNGTMKNYGERGYIVKENGPVYFTKNVMNTVKWFEDILGWYGDVVAKDNEGKEIYGCVFDYPSEIAIAHLVPFRGFHLFRGEPIKNVVGFIMIEGIDKFYNLVKDNGWNQISDISSQSWGRECDVTTIDGCILRFFESV